MLEKCNHHRPEGKRKVVLNKKVSEYICSYEYRRNPNKIKRAFLQKTQPLTAQKTGSQKNKYQEFIFLLSSNFLAGPLID